MAEGGDRKKDFEKITQLKPSTKQEAINALGEIISDINDEEKLKTPRDFLKTLKESGTGLDEPLSTPDREIFLKITAEEKEHTEHNEELVLAAFMSDFRKGLRQHQFLKVVNEGNAMFEMEGKLRSTKERLQDAMDRLNTMQQELTQVKNQQSSERLVFEQDRTALRNQLSIERQQFEREINALRDIIYKLSDEKRELKRQIEELRTKLEEEKDINDKYKHDQEIKLETISQNNIREITELRGNIEKLEKENRKLKTPEAYRLVSHCVTLMTNALYKWVHQTELKKNYYSIDDLKKHMRTKYKGNEEGQRASERRWEDIKGRIGWIDGTESVLHQLAESRERGPKSFNDSVEYPQFSEAVRIMFGDQEIDEDDMELILDLYAKCNHHLSLTTKQN